MDFQQSQTYSNLQRSYDGELMTSTKYAIYGEKARIDGYMEIGDIFDITSGNEKAHAVIWLRLLNNGVLPTTEENLLSSSQTDEFVGSETYREYARIAREEGYNDIAALFNGVANIELNHELKFRTLFENVIRDEVFCKPVDVLWICMRCGNIMSGICAPEICPVCGFPQGYYRLYDTDEI